jgi:Flp pilus assembly protein TadD
MSDAVQLQLALADHQSGHVDRAVLQYRQLLCGAPANTEGMYLFGVVLSQAGSKAVARKFFERAVVIRPLVAALHRGLGDACRDVGDGAAARVAFEAAVRLDPGEAENHNALGLLLRELGNVEEALAAFRAGLAWIQKTRDWATTGP